MRAQLPNSPVYSQEHLEAAQRHTYREAPPRVPTSPSPPTASEQLAALLASPKRSLTALQTLALHHQDALTPEERVLLLDALMEPAPEPAPEPQPEYKQITATEQWAALDKARTYQDVLQPDLSKAWQQQQEQQQRVLQRQMELQKQMEDHQRRGP